MCVQYVSLSVFDIVETEEMRTYCNHLFSLKRFKFIFQKKKTGQRAKAYNIKNKQKQQISHSQSLQNIATENL